MFCLQLNIDFNTPELPPLSDPELFENIFLKRFSYSQPKFMQKYEESLLRSIIYNVLAELLGKNNIRTISFIIDFAVSNMFYERLIQHCDLQKLCRVHEIGSILSSKAIVVKRGDVLEAYIAAIEMDISRCCGESFREIRE